MANDARSGPPSGANGPAAGVGARARGRAEVVLGVSGRREDAAVALAVDGRIVAAACESSLIGRAAAGYRAIGPPPVATAACLQQAGLRASDVTHIVIADDRLQGDRSSEQIGHSEQSGRGGSRSGDRWRDRSDRSDPSGRSSGRSGDSGESGDSGGSRDSRDSGVLSSAHGEIPGDRLLRVAKPWRTVSAVPIEVPSLRWLEPRDEDDERLAGLLDRPVTRIGSAFAAAVQAALATDDPRPAVVVLEAMPLRHGTSFAWSDGRLQQAGVVPGFANLLACASRFNEALGLGRRSDVDALALLGQGETAVWAEAFRRAWALHNGGMASAPGWADAAIDIAREGVPGRLDAAASPHRAVQERRRQLAASFSDLLASLVGDLLVRVRDGAGARTVSVGGDLFGSAQLNTRLREAFGDALAIAPVPEAVGGALGAALAPAFLDGRAARIARVSLGPTFSETEIKNTLDNCRLDYVYEPDWQRLLTRVSGLLARGRTVAWYQGAVDFGPRSTGNRSILSDPSSRYARDNINQYLLRRALDHPLPVAMTRETAAEYLVQPLIPPFTLQFATVREACADRLKGVLDASRGCPVHGVDRHQAPELCDLLDLHRARTQVPGLIHLTLASAGEPLAGTPRAAIRAMFSSAIDVLVMGRFLLMKDYWLLRSDT